MDRNVGHAIFCIRCSKPRLKHFTAQTSNSGVTAPSISQSRVPWTHVLYGCIDPTIAAICTPRAVHICCTPHAVVYPHEYAAQQTTALHGLQRLLRTTQPCEARDSITSHLSPCSAQLCTPPPPLRCWWGQCHAVPVTQHHWQQCPATLAGMQQSNQQLASLMRWFSYLSWHR
jgi:hypothetical protein